MAEIRERLNQLAEEKREYLLRNLPTHLYEAQDVSHLRQLLITFDFLETKILAFGTHLLIADYDLMTPQTSTATHNSFNMIGRTVRIAAHILDDDPSQLASQLLARLPPTEPEFVMLRSQAEEWNSAPWLQPLYSSLQSGHTPLQRTLSGHREQVNTVAVTPDGMIAVSGAGKVLVEADLMRASEDNTLHIWDLSNGQLLHTLSGHSDKVTGVAVTDDGSWAVSSSEDHSIRLWNLRSGQEQWILTQDATSAPPAVVQGPQGNIAIGGVRKDILRIWDLTRGLKVRTSVSPIDGVTAIAATPDGNLMILASADGTLTAWSISEMRLLSTLKGHSKSITRVSITPDGSFAISASKDKTIKIWDIHRGQELQSVNNTSEIIAVGIAPDGKRFACLSENLPSFNGKLQVWTSGHKIAEFTIAESSIAEIMMTLEVQKVIVATHNTVTIWDLTNGRKVRQLEYKRDILNYVRAVALSPDGRRAIVAHREKYIRIWDVKSRRELYTLPLSTELDNVSQIAVTHDGQRGVAVAGTRIMVWDLASGSVLYTLNDDSIRMKGVATFQEQQLLSVSRAGLVEVWDIPGGHSLHCLIGHSEPTALGIAHSISGLSTVTLDGILDVWDIEQGELVHTLTGHPQMKTIAITPDGQSAITTSDGNIMQVWNLSDGILMHTLSIHSSRNRATAISPDGKLAIEAADDNVLSVWDLDNGRKVYSLRGHIAAVTSLVVMPNGKRAISASVDRTLKVWDLATGNELCTLLGHSATILAVAVTVDGHIAISASRDRTLRVWDVSETAMLQNQQVQAPVTAVAITPDGHYGISASVNKMLKVWSMVDGQEIRTMLGHNSKVTALATTPDSHHVLSGAVDGSVKLWDVITGSVVRSFAGPSKDISALLATIDGRYCVATDVDNTWWMWDLRTGKEVANRGLNFGGQGTFIKFTPDRRYGIANTSDIFRDMQTYARITIWNVQRGKPDKKHAFQIQGYVDAVTVLPDGQHMIYAPQRDHVLNVYDIARKKIIQSLQGHVTAITAIEFSQNYVISASRDATIKVWDMSAGTCIATFTMDFTPTAFAIAPDTMTIIAGDLSGLVHILRLQRKS
jgi:WD40 repeat protein